MRGRAWFVLGLGIGTATRLAFALAARIVLERDLHRRPKGA